MTDWKEALVFLALSITIWVFWGWGGAVGVLAGWVAHLLNRRLLLCSCLSGPMERMPQRLQRSAAIRLLLIAVILGAFAGLNPSALLWGAVTLALGQILWFFTLIRMLTKGSDREGFFMSRDADAKEAQNVERD